MDYFNHDIVPLFGPTPQEFKNLGLRPCTFFSDDHTPMELIWAVDADGKMSVRFAMEPLDYTDGRPSSSEEWMTTLHNLQSWHRTKSWSLEWTDICRETLILDHVQGRGGQEAKYPSQFFLGTSFSDGGIYPTDLFIHKGVTFRRNQWLENSTSFLISAQQRPKSLKKILLLNA
jgi:hypothetical protein